MLPPSAAWTQPCDWHAYHDTEVLPPPAGQPPPRRPSGGTGNGRDAAAVGGADRRAAARLVLLLDAAAAASRSPPPSAASCASPLESLLPPKRVSPLPAGAPSSLATLLTGGGRSAVYGDDPLS